MYKNDNFEILILAAGKGKRMLSDLPKVLVNLKGNPMIKHVLDTVAKAFAKKPIVIVGHKKELVQELLKDSVFYAIQEEQLGTGHAVSSAKDLCKDKKHIMVLSGDQPLLTPKTLIDLIEKHENSNTKITFTTTKVENFEDWRKGFLGFGRILREGDKVVGIKEYRDASEEEKNILEVNAGTYIFEAPWIWDNLKNIKNKNAQGEYYLTDLFHIAFLENEKIETISIDPKEALGANSKEELEILETFNI